MQAYDDPRIEPLLKELGTFRGVSGEKAAQINHYKELLKPAALEQADLAEGRVVFNRSCAACHTLFDAGGNLAPELTGSQRASLDYILENVIDPNAVVWDRYKATYFETSDDRLISGVVVQENDSIVTIQTQTGAITVPRNEIVTRNQSQLSMMPEGLFEALEPQEVINLFGYLQSPSQVPLPNGKK
jgi:putative heme-binding domain-containing protein